MANSHLPSFTIVVQAGGKSTRMGQDKALVPLRGKPLITQVLKQVAFLADEVIVTTNRPEDYRFLQLPLAEDIIADRGALGGLYTALSAANNPLVGVVACDMPFASAAILRFAYELMENEDIAAAIPQTSSGSEPFHAVYRRKTCLPVIEQALEHNLWRVDSWYSNAPIHFIAEEIIAQIDPGGMAFWNLNTPEDLDRANTLT